MHTMLIKKNTMSQLSLLWTPGQSEDRGEHRWNRDIIPMNLKGKFLPEWTLLSRDVDLF